MKYYIKTNTKKIKITDISLEGTTMHLITRRRLFQESDPAIENERRRPKPQNVFSTSPDFPYKTLKYDGAFHFFKISGSATAIP